MNRSKSTFCLSFINYKNNDDWIKQWVLTVGKPLSTCQTSDRRYVYSLWVRYIRTIYIYVIFMVYSDDIRLLYIYGFYFSSKKKFIYIPPKYLKYNVRKGMVGRSEDVPWTFECLVGKNGKRTSMQPILLFSESHVNVAEISAEAFFFKYEITSCKQNKN